MIDTQSFHESLKNAGFSMFTGVADSTTQEWLKLVYQEPHHVIATNECEALAIAAGHYLSSNDIACVYLQNAGLGKIVNPLTSLCTKEVSRIPALLVIGWRGAPGTTDEPQHAKMGQITAELLDLLGIPYSEVTEGNFVDIASQAMAWMREHKTPYALLVRKGQMEKVDAVYPPEYLVTEPTREQAIHAIVAASPVNSIFVTTTGKTSRELYEYRIEQGQSTDSDFLNVGAMGSATAIALGIAGNTERPVIVIDGDGACMMQLGTLITAGALFRPNLLHIVLDNQAFDSTGGQPTFSDCVGFTDVAATCGLEASAVHNLSDLQDAVKRCITHSKPSFIHMPIARGARSDLGRPKSTPSERAAAFTREVCS